MKRMDDAVASEELKNAVAFFGGVDQAVAAAVRGAGCRDEAEPDVLERGDNTAPGGRSGFDEKVAVGRDRAAVDAPLAAPVAVPADLPPEEWGLRVRRGASGVEAGSGAGATGLRDVLSMQRQTNALMERLLAELGGVRDRRAPDAVEAAVAEVTRRLG